MFKYGLTNDEKLADLIAKISSLVNPYWNKYSQLKFFKWPRQFYLFSVRHYLAQFAGQSIFIWNITYFIPFSKRLFKYLQFLLPNDSGAKIYCIWYNTICIRFIFEAYLSDEHVEFKLGLINLWHLDMIVQSFSMRVQIRLWPRVSCSRTWTQQKIGCICFKVPIGRCTTGWWQSR